MGSPKIWAFCSVFLAIVSLTAVVSEETCSHGEHAPALPAALEYLEEHKEEAQQDALDLVTIPSISSMPDYKEHVREAGQWLVRRMRKAGLEVSHLITTACPHTVMHCTCNTISSEKTCVLSMTD